MTKLFSKLIGVNSVMPNVPAYCEVNTKCSSGRATYYYINGKLVFARCGC